MRIPILRFALGWVACLGVMVAGCGSSPMTRLTLVTFAVTRAAYSQIIPQFEEQWQAQTGQQIQVDVSYGGSAAQARAVIDGLDADVVNLALALDIDRIQSAGLIQPGWQDRTPNGGIVTQSVAVIVTRPGNPRGIRDWQDLAQPGLEVVTANPKTSGGARWNFLAVWGSVRLDGGSPDQALAFTTQVYQNVGVLPRDTREATDVFVQKGQGDVLITSENEVLLANLRGEDLPYVIPGSTISIDNPVALVDENVDRKGTREAAEAFVQFLFSPQAQREFAAVGFRPIAPEVAAELIHQYPALENLFGVEALGGWEAIQDQFFRDGAIFDHIQAQL